LCLFKDLEISISLFRNKCKQTTNTKPRTTCLRCGKKTSHNNSVYFVRGTSEITIQFSIHMPWWITAVMGFDRFARTGSWNFFLTREREPVVGLSQVFSIFPHEHLLLITYFEKPLIDPVDNF